MNRTGFPLSLLVMGLLLSCQLIGGSNSNLDPSEVIIRHGYSFGFCAGHCLADMTVQEGEQSLILRSWQRDTDPPDKMVSRDIDSAAFGKIVRTIDYPSFCAMDETYGCPDCADGGAEYVELTCEDGKKKVTFEYGAELPELRSLLAELRPLRQALLDELD